MAAHISKVNLTGKEICVNRRFSHSNERAEMDSLIVFLPVKIASEEAVA